MTEEIFSDEILMRFADGELDPETSSALERAMETDDALISRLAVFLETRTMAQAALRPMLDEPVPEALKASVERMIAAKRDEARREETGQPAQTVVPFRARPATPTTRWMLPLAASLAAIVGGIGGYWAAGTNDAATGGVSIAGIVGPPLRDALETVESGKELQIAGGDRFRAIATFRNQADEICREFEVDLANSSTVISVACAEGDQWTVSFAVSAPGNAQGYAPASSTEALDAYLSAIDAGDPLSADEEARALAQARAK